MGGTLFKSSIFWIYLGKGHFECFEKEKRYVRHGIFLVNGQIHRVDGLGPRPFLGPFKIDRQGYD